MIPRVHTAGQNAGELYAVLGEFEVDLDHWQAALNYF
jgi:hypothetical protein